jgi:Holliday junction resolvase-like predicted endonuclease
MDEIQVQTVLNEPSIRKAWHEGELYYNAIDVVCFLLNCNFKRGRNYYHVLKNTMMKNKQPLLTVQLRAKSSDNKKYLTDFIRQSDLELLTQVLEVNRQKRHLRIEVRKDDEVKWFHPQIMLALETNKWNVEQHVRLPSGNIIDIVAKQGERTLVVECKPRLAQGKFYSALGQVLSYCAEYPYQAEPAIACYKNEKNAYAQQICLTLGVRLLEVTDIFK